MNVVMMIIQVVAALGLFNVWVIRNQMKTNFRGGDAKNLEEEFSTYGLPKWIYYLVGFLKISIGIFFIAGLWMPSLVGPAAGMLILLMIGALAMHIQVKDRAYKMVPAFTMLVMSLFLFLSTIPFYQA